MRRERMRRRKLSVSWPDVPPSCPPHTRLVRRGRPSSIHLWNNKDSSHLSSKKLLKVLDSFLFILIIKYVCILIDHLRPANLVHLVYLKKPLLVWYSFWALQKDHIVWIASPWVVPCLCKEIRQAKQWNTPPSIEWQQGQKGLWTIGWLKKTES